MSTSTVLIKVRYVCGTYAARAQKFHGVHASCSCDPGIHAVRLCALKCKAWPTARVIDRVNFFDAGIKLTKVSTDGVGASTYRATWEAK